MYDKVASIPYMVLYGSNTIVHIPIGTPIYSRYKR